VVSDLFVTDTALYADCVPRHDQIEHLDLSPAWGHLYSSTVGDRAARQSVPTPVFRRLAAARPPANGTSGDEPMFRGARAGPARMGHAGGGEKDPCA
jgi:hypothetical protein